MTSAVMYVPSTSKSMNNLGWASGDSPLAPLRPSAQLEIGAAKSERVLVDLPSQKSPPR